MENKPISTRALKSLMLASRKRLFKLQSLLEQESPGIDKYDSFGRKIRRKKSRLRGSDLVSLQQAAIVLNLSHPVAATWCVHNGITILENNHYQKFVLRAQLEYVRLKNFIDYLRSRYKGKWLEKYHVYIKLKIMNLNWALETEVVGSGFSSANFPTAGQHDSFISRLTKENPEL